MEMSATETQTQRTTYEKPKKGVLFGTLRQLVRSGTRPSEKRSVLATSDVSARGLDADPETAPMTSATLPLSSTATNLRRRWDVDQSCAGKGDVT
jgi:hypothetical protein